MIFRRFSVPALALLFTGCLTQNTALPYSLRITEEGLGAIHADTPFDQVSTSLSGFTFEKLSQISPDQSEMIYQMKRGERVLAHIVSDPSGKKIATIHILSPLIKNKYDQGVGDPLPRANTLLCTAEECRYQDEPSLSYRIDPNQRTIREITFSRL
ncbi:hypothetical protein [Sulfuricurvum sp.]|uniref:hypothetical protein n=1 Tax=Sulfuricurvum sp. TaxID=2025608 RepID=UPI003C421C53